MPRTVVGATGSAVLALSDPALLQEERIQVIQIGRCDLRQLLLSQIELDVVVDVLAVAFQCVIADRSYHALV